MSTTPMSVLLVDDEAGLRRAPAKILSLDGAEVSVAANGTDAIALMAGKTFDVIVSDIRMPGMDGMSLLRAIRARDLDVPVVFLTGSPTIETAMEAMEYGAFRYLVKPVDPDELR